MVEFFSKTAVSIRSIKNKTARRLLNDQNGASFQTAARVMASFREANPNTVVFLRSSRPRLPLLRDQGVDVFIELYGIRSIKNKTARRLINDRNGASLQTTAHVMASFREANPNAVVPNFLDAKPSEASLQAVDASAAALATEMFPRA